ncbi:cation transporter [Tenacibaculum finnmarkense]|uniref:cation transporter n=1 Tax=Tenacibaculum finnmarkense TaxID=2781243 RepID=UPI001E3AFAD5|nr:heavy metal-associated domain-containing protein [Tenacibaculum finnmarkense]MCD8446597.1 cation transporter [Tenacibaculum finnmarkense genomovar finnmarkense]
MKIQKIIFALALVSFLVVGCKNEAKKENTPKVEKTTVIADKKEISLNISGMTCEIGCAKKIASDLSKKEGVLEANVIFKDSVANVKYDANITNKADLIAFVEGVGNGKLYKASETSKKSCSAKKACTHAKKDGKICDAACEKACCAKNDADKKACATNCEKACCAKNDAQKKA